jgi:hypothetical protein
MTKLLSSSPSKEASAAAAVVTLCCNGCVYLWNTGSDYLFPSTTVSTLFTVLVTESNIAKLTAACYLSSSGSTDDDDVDLVSFSSSDASPEPSLIIPCTAATIIGKPYHRTFPGYVTHMKNLFQADFTVISSPQPVVAMVEALSAEVVLL